MARLWLSAWLLVAAGTMTLPGWWGRVHQPPADLAGRSTTPASRPIEAIRVGDRVWAYSPDSPGQLSDSGTAVDPATWRRLGLRAETTWEDGTRDTIEVETLQPPAWLAAHGARVGAEVALPLDLMEMGLPPGLRARVVDAGPCPPIRPGPGRVVLTTVNHLNRDVHELTVRDAAGHEETFRPTGLHKLYREDDRAWISAGALRPGNRLRGLWGSLTVVANRALPGVHRVYNLTVEGEHVYRVSALGALAHNNQCAAPLPGEVPRAPNPNAPRPVVESPKGANPRVTQELPPGDVRTPKENDAARQFFKNHRDKARKWWEERNGQPWPKNSTHDHHPRPLSEGGDPLLVEPGYGPSTNEHSREFFQAHGRRGGIRSGEVRGGRKN